MCDKHRGPKGVSSLCIHATVVITYVSSNGSYGCERVDALYPWFQLKHPRRVVCPGWPCATRACSRRGEGRVRAHIVVDNFFEPLKLSTYVTNHHTKLDL